jgi:hypothetical protein
MQNTERKWSEMMNPHLCAVLLSASCFYYCPFGYLKITAPTLLPVVITLSLLPVLLKVLKKLQFKQ